MPRLSRLVELRHSLHDALQSDLETGSHYFNNAEAKKFAVAHPRLMKWIGEFCDEVDAEVAEIEKQL